MWHMEPATEADEKPTMAREALIKTLSRHRRETAAWLAWSLVGLSLALFVAGLAFLAGVPAEQVSGNWGTGGIGAQLIFAPFLAFSVVGALIVSRQPANLVGWVSAADGFVWMLAIFGGPYAAYGLANPGTVPYPLIVYALTAWLWAPAVGLLGIYLPLLFPDGRLPSRRWRYLVLFAGAVIVVESACVVLAPGPLDGLPGTRNPFGISGYPWLEGVGIFAVATIPLCILAAVAGLISRFRRSDREVRQQIKWLALAASLVGLAYLGTVIVMLLETSSPGSARPPWLLLLQNAVLLSYAVVPLAVGTAVLKHRLYDVDLVINRALVYGSLTVSIVGVYAITVGYLGTLLRAGWNLPISLVATGLVAVLFAPLRERLQRGVNRLMYGERDDPYAVLSRLGRRLEGTLAPEAVLPAVVENIARALRLPHVAVWLVDGEGLHLEAANGKASSTTTVQDARAIEVLSHSPEGTDPAELGESEAYGSVLADSNVALALPLFHGGELIGALCMAPRGPGESFSTADRRLLRDLATQVSAAANSVRLTGDLRSSLKELRRSREDLVEAQEEERRRVQRDLHDGLGPILASMRLRLEACLDATQSTEDPLAHDLERLYELVGQATSDIRRLVYDLRPPVLDQLGLVPALGQHCERFSRETGIEVGFYAGPGLSIPAAAEVTILRVVQEALLNVQKHARASRADVRLHQRDRYLELGVGDDGVGLDAGSNGVGTGIGSMRERAELLGGTLRLDGGPGAGTKVMLRIPVEEARR